MTQVGITELNAAFRKLREIKRSVDSLENWIIRMMDDLALEALDADNSQPAGSPKGDGA
jgi:hypothetical protein